MSTQGHFNSKSPTIKRILKEAKELQTSPSRVYHAAPLEENLFEWHFTIRGPPPPSDFAGGIYHGRIVLPNSYPLRPPSFRFLTPSGRFEVNREICLSISGHHEETWQPAWGIRTALVAIRSFMDSDAMGQLGGLTTGKAVRARLADASRAWKCATCGGCTNEQIMMERQAECEAEHADVRADDEAVPDELRLGYRDELEPQAPEAPQKSSKLDEESAASGGPPATAHSRAASSAGPASTAHTGSSSPRASSGEPGSQPARAALSQASRTPSRRSLSGWIDLAIVGVSISLLVMLLRTTM